MINIRDLNFHYPGGFELNIPELALSEGKIYLLTGPNGSGKSTLLEILALLLPATYREFLYRGSPLPDSGRKLLEIRREMTLMEQNPYLFRTTVVENLAYGLTLRRFEKREIATRVDSILKLLGLEEFRDRRVDQLSGGEKQKVALARSLLIRPEVLLLDEPTANVDQASVEFIEDKIKEFHRERKGVVIWATHNREQAYRVGDEILSLLEGKLVPGTIDNLYFGEVSLDDGETYFFFNQDLKASIPPRNPGPARMIIHPEEIIVSFSPLASSARNSFPGRVIRIEELGRRVAINVDIGVPMQAIITGASYAELDLKLGSRIYLTFKATAASVV
jgi:molybdopterin-binding protein